MLDLAKVESGKMEVFIEELDVAELVRGIEATVQPLIRKNRNALEVAGLDGLGAMHSDATKLRQILLNLLSNASKFTKTGSIFLDIERETDGGEDWLRFRVPISTAITAITTSNSIKVNPRLFRRVIV